jgi:hypothetical protein
VAIPTIVGVGAGTSGTGAVTPAYPGGYTAVADDVALTFVESESTDTVTPPTNWALLIASNLASGVTSKLSVLWRRLTAAEAAPTIADAGDHMNARMIIIRGCATTGNPWDVSTQTTEAVADTTVSIPTVTTTVANTLVLAAFGTGQDIASTAGATGWANANLASPSITEQMDNWVADGLGGGFAMAAGGKASAGATGATTATLSLTANFKTLITIAMRQPPVVPPPNKQRGYQGYPYVVVQ